MVGSEEEVVGDNVRLPTQRFHPAERESDYSFDDEHGWEPVLQREITVEAPDENEYEVQLERASLDGPWEAVSTDAPLEHARAAMDAAERKCN